MTILQQTIIAIAAGTADKLQRSLDVIRQHNKDQNEVLARGNEQVQIWVKNSVALATSLCQHPSMNTGNQLTEKQVKMPPNTQPPPQPPAMAKKVAIIRPHGNP